eukprot:1181631-Prorocentrum_minimum.AAC.8
MCIRGAGTLARPHRISVAQSHSRSHGPRAIQGVPRVNTFGHVACTFGHAGGRFRPLTVLGEAELVEVVVGLDKRLRGDGPLRHRVPRIGGRGVHRPPRRRAP